MIVFDNFTRGTLENLGQALQSQQLRIVNGDIRDADLLACLLPGVDIVFHQAAIRITQCADDPRLAFDVLATGTFNVLEAAVKAKVSKVVAASSASVLGLAESFPTTEGHHPYNNRTIYGAAKAFNEGLLRSFAEMYGLNYVALRYFNVYGPRMDMFGVYTEVLIRWMDRIAAGEAPIIFGDGAQTMDFVHVRDIARANMLAAKSDVTDEVFNVASGEETSLLRAGDDACESHAVGPPSRSCSIAAGERRLATAGRHPQGGNNASLQGRDRPGGGVEGSGRLVASVQSRKRRWPPNERSLRHDRGSQAAYGRA